MTQEDTKVVLKLSISEANQVFGRDVLRNLMPETTVFVDKVKESFPNSSLIYARENGLEIGDPVKKNRLVPWHSHEKIVLKTQTGKPRRRK